MTKERIIQLAYLLGTQGHQERDSWIIFSCPFAAWKHSNGTDNHPSFGIEVNEHAPSRCHCFSCGTRGELEATLMEFVYYQRKYPMPGIDLKAIMQLLATEEEHIVPGIEPVDYEKLKKNGVPQKLKFIPFPEMWLDTFLKTPHHPYLESRGVSPKTAIDLDLRYDFSQRRICYPFRTFDGTLAGLQGRSIDKATDLRYKLYDHQGHYNVTIWGNEHLLDLDRAVVVCEGFFDVASIFPVYRNVACSFTSDIIPAKMKRLRDAAMLITFYDFGTGGNHARGIFNKFAANNNIPLYHLVPDEQTGDVGNMGPEEVREALANILPLEDLS